MWIVENENSFVPLPKFLTSTTQLQCKIEDINIKYWDDEVRNFSKNNRSSSPNYSILNTSDSDDSCDENEKNINFSLKTARNEIDMDNLRKMSYENLLTPINRNSDSRYQIYCYYYYFV